MSDGSSSSQHEPALVMGPSPAQIADGRHVDKGHSPFDILGIDLGEKDWRTLLGYPPVH